MTEILLTIAILPTIFLLIFIYYKDSYEKEPASLLFQLFLLGVAAIIPALIWEIIGEALVLLIAPSGTILYNFLYAFFVVALAEESCKFLFTYIRTWNSEHFNFKFDGIVYAVFVSLGFATLENILYVFDGGIVTGIIRALISVPSHAIDAIFMGYFYGLAKQWSSRGNKVRAVFNMCLGLFTATLLHGFFDFCLFEQGYWLLAFIIFVIAMDVVAILRVHFSSKHDEQIFMRNYYNYYNYGNQINNGNWVGPQSQPMNNGNWAGPQRQPMNNGNWAGPQGQPMNNVIQGRPMGDIRYTQNNNNIFMGNRKILIIYCAYCGNSNNMNSFYCFKCGKALRKY